MQEAIHWAAPVLYDTFFDLPIWQQFLFGVIAGIFGFFPAALAGATTPSVPWWARVAVVLVGMACTGAVLLVFMLSSEIQWGGRCAPGC